MDDYDVIIIGRAPAAARSPGTSRPPASASCCSSVATGCRASSRTGSRRRFSSTTATSRPDTWYDASGKPFQPRRPLLRRRRDEDLRRGALPAAQGGLRRAAAPRRHLAGLADLLRRARAVLHAGRAALPGARSARRGSDRAAGERAVPAPGRLARAADPAARRRPAAAGYHPFHAPCGIMLDESNPPFSRCMRCATCDGFPCLVHAKSDAEVLGVRPALEHPNVTLLTNAKVDEARHERRRAPRSRRSSSSGTARRRGSPATSSSSPAARPTAAKLLLAVGERQAPERARQRLGPGRPQLHVPRLHRCPRAVTRGEPDRVPEDARPQRLLLRQRRLRVPARERPDGRQVAGADVPRRAARARRSSRPSGHSSGWRATRSTSGSRPRICRSPTTASPSTATASSRSPTPRPTPRRRSGSTPRSSRCSGSST